MKTIQCCLTHVVMFLFMCVQVLWSDIGGEEEIKEKLRDSVDRPLNHPEVLLIAKQGFSPLCCFIPGLQEVRNQGATWSAAVRSSRLQ